MGVQTPNPTVNADARRRGFARTAVAGYLVVGHLLSEDRYDRFGSILLKNSVFGGAQKTAAPQRLRSILDVGGDAT